MISLTSKNRVLISRINLLPKLILEQFKIDCAVSKSTNFDFINFFVIMFVLVLISHLEKPCLFNCIRTKNAINNFNS